MNTKDLNERITGEVIRAMEKGVIPWHKPWICTGANVPDPRVLPVSYSTGRCYSLLNQWLIMFSGHGAGEYATFNQIRQLGGTVKKGEHGATVYFFKMGNPVPVKDENGKTAIDENRNIITYTPRYAWLYKVFNVYTQCEGIDPKWLKRAEDAERESQGKTPDPIEAAQRLMDGYLTRESVVLTHGGNQAFYNGGNDSITLPPKFAFDDMPHYYKTAYHEIGHSTGAKKRLNRKMGGRFGSQEYGREELVAEMTSAFLCGVAGIPIMIDDTAAYLKSWLKTIREDADAIPYAARQAAKALDFITGAKANAEEENAA